MAGVRGRRKAVLLFSEGLEMPMSEIYGVHTATDVVGAIKDAITAAARSNVNFFALDPRGLIGMTTEYIETGRLWRARRGWAHSARLNAAAGAADRYSRVAGQPAHALGRNRRIRGRQYEHARLGVQSHRRCEQPVLRARATTRRRRRATAGSIASKSGSKRPGLRVSARTGLCIATRHEPRPNASATKRRGARATRNAAWRNNTIARAARGAQRSTAAERAHVLVAGGAVQAEPERGVGRAGHRARRRAAASLRRRTTARSFANNLELSFFGINQDGRAQRSTRSELNLTLAARDLKRVGTGGLRANPRSDAGSRPLPDSRRCARSARQQRRDGVLRPAGAGFPQRSR